MKSRRRRSARRSNTTSRTKRGSSHGHNHNNGFHLPKEGRVTVYGNSSCPWCKKMKQHLRPNRDVYVELAPHLMPAFKRYITPRIQGQTSIPIVFVGTKFIGGYEDYMKFIRNLKQ